MNHEQAAALEAREALLALEAEAANGAGEVVGHQRKARPGGLGAEDLAGYETLPESIRRERLPRAFRSACRAGA